jgi:hypothetical protein
MSAQDDPTTTPIAVVLGELVASLQSIGGLVESMPHLVNDEVSARAFGSEILRRLNRVRDDAARSMLVLSGLEVPAAKMSSALDAALESLRGK